MPRVTLYGKPDCHLCEEARTVLEAARRKWQFELEEIDIHSDPELLAAYFERIPVIAVDGREAFEYFVDRHRLERLLAGAAERPGA